MDSHLNTLRKITTLKPWATFWHIILFLSLGALLFGPAITYSFVYWDDTIHILFNPHQTEPLLSSISFYWTHFYLNLYMPLTYTLWAILGKLPQLTESPASTFHAFLLLLHCLDAFFVSRIATPILKNSSWGIVAGLLFLLHPLQIESFLWVSELKGLLAFFFGALSVLSYMNWQNSAKRRDLLFALLLYLLALLSKPSVVTLPAILIALEIHRRGEFHWTSLKPTMPFFVLAFGMALLTKIAQPTSGVEDVIPLYLRLILPLHVMGFYSSQILFPSPLLINYSHTPTFVINHLFSHWYWLLGLGLIVCSLFMERLRWFLLFVVLLLPVLGISPFLYQKFSLTADRYTYFPLVVVIIGLLSLLPSEKGVPQVHLSVTFLFLLIFATLSVQQSRLWENSEPLFLHTLKHNPQAEEVYTNLANFYLLEKKPVAAAAVLDAYAHQGFESPLALQKRAELFAEEQNIPKADSVYQRWHKHLQKEPADSTWEKFFTSYASYLLNTKKKYDEARVLYQKLVALYPSNPDYSENLGRAHLLLYQPQEALTAFQGACQKSSDPTPTYFGLALAYQELNQPDSASYYFSKIPQGHPLYGEAQREKATITQLPKNGEEAVRGATDSLP